MVTLNYCSLLRSHLDVDDYDGDDSGSVPRLMNQVLLMDCGVDGEVVAVVEEGLVPRRVVATGN